MEAVGDLNGVRCTLTTTLGIRTSTIANDNLDTGMTPQPIGENFGSALIDQVDGAMRFQVDQDRAVASFTSTQRKVIDTQHAWGGHCLVLDGAQQPQQRIGTDWYASGTCQPRSTFTSGLQCERRQQIGGGVGPPRIARQCTVEALREDLPRARWRVAEPAAAVYPHSYGLPAPGEIERVALVATVLPPTQLTALRTRHRHPRRFDDQNHTAVTFDDDQDDAPAFRLCPKRRGHRDSPQRS